eukprot:scaffold1638_cov258-Pinguiococcus_pyrenoidosus.AAC.18
MPYETSVFRRSAMDLPVRPSHLATCPLLTVFSGPRTIPFVLVVYNTSPTAPPCQGCRNTDGTWRPWR